MLLPWWRGALQTGWHLRLKGNWWCVAGNSSRKEGVLRMIVGGLGYKKQLALENGKAMPALKHSDFPCHWCQSKGKQGGGETKQKQKINTNILQEPSALAGVSYQDIGSSSSSITGISPSTLGLLNKSWGGRECNVIHSVWVQTWLQNWISLATQWGWVSEALYYGGSIHIFRAMF